jgi:hypothetical protein
VLGRPSELARLIGQVELNRKPKAFAGLFRRTKPITSGLRMIQDERTLDVFTLASPRCLDGGDVDPLHRHHRLESTLCLTATSRKRIG